MKLLASRPALVLAGMVVLLACRDRERPPPDSTAKAPVEIIAAPADQNVAAVVQQELGRAGADGRELLVYVGAAWCEPCQRFHDAAKAGELDQVFPGLRLLEFDLDRDRARLRQAGYASDMIPLFALPQKDGTASGEQIAGSVKGTGAVAELSPRLRKLLNERRGDAAR